MEGGRKWYVNPFSGGGGKATIVDLCESNRIDKGGVRSTSELVDSGLCHIDLEVVDGASGGTSVDTDGIDVGTSQQTHFAKLFGSIDVGCIAIGV